MKVLLAIVLFVICGLAYGQQQLQAPAVVLNPDGACYSSTGSPTSNYWEYYEYLGFAGAAGTSAAIQFAPVVVVHRCFSTSANCVAAIVSVTQFTQGEGSSSNGSIYVGRNATSGCFHVN